MKHSVTLFFLSILIHGGLLSQTYSYKEVVAIAAVINSECSICDDNEKALVASVILNRVERPEFPDDVLGVISQAEQFWRQGLFITDNEIRIVEDAIWGFNRDYDVLYFFQEDSPNQAFVKSMMADGDFIRGQYHIFK